MPSLSALDDFEANFCTQTMRRVEREAWDDLRSLRPVDTVAMYVATSVLAGILRRLEGEALEVETSRMLSNLLRDPLVAVFREPSQVTHQDLEILVANYVRCMNELI